MTNATANSAQLSQEETARLLRLATYASTSVAVFLIAAKLFAWAASDSVSLLATLIDSILDALASLINLVAVRHALTPADREHRFGHGKAEALAGLSQSLFIAGSAAYLLLEAAERIINPVAVESIALGIWVMILSIVATLLLLGFQQHVLAKPTQPQSAPMPCTTKPTCWSTAALSSPWHWPASAGMALTASLVRLLDSIFCSVPERLLSPPAIT